MGRTLMLTTGVDNLPGLIGSAGSTGTDGDDTIVGTDTTFTALDSINGGLGANTLKLNWVTGAAAIPGGVTVEKIQTVQLASANDVGAKGGGNAFDTSAWTDTTQLNVTIAKNVFVAAATTTNISVAGATNAIQVDGGKNITVTDATADTAINIGQTTVNAGTITVTDSKQGKGNIAIDGGTTVTVTATADQTTTAGKAGNITVGNTTGKLPATSLPSGAITVTQNLNSDGTAALTGGVIDVEGGTSATVNVVAKVTALNSTASKGITSGAVNVTSGGSTKDVTVTQSYSETEFTKAGTAVVKEVSTVTFEELAKGKTVTFNGLTFTANQDLTAEKVAQAFANLTAADTQSATGPIANGVYTGAFNTAVWTSGAASGKTVTFTAIDDSETGFTFSGTAALLPTKVNVAGKAAVADVTSANAMTFGAVRVDDVATASITTVTLDGYASADLGNTGADLNALTTLSLANGTGAVNLATSAKALDLTVNNVTGATNIDKTGATIATLNVTTATKASAINLTGAAVTTLNVAGTQMLNLTGSTIGALETVVVTGSAGLNLGAVTAAKSITTTGTTGTVTASIDATKATYTGGDGVDNVTTTTTAPTKAISLGGGNDTMTLAAGTTAMGAGGTIDGGTGTNTLSMVAADAVTASGSAAFATKVTNFQKLVLTGATGTQEVKALALGNYNDVEVAAATAGSALTVSGLTSGATIRLNDNKNVQTIANITDATKIANASDVLNIAIGASVAANGTADENGIVRADGVETFNISVTDTLIQTPNVAPDAQKLTLVGTSATTINITGDTALTLNTAANQKVTTINAADFKGALTVTAAGGVASTITGGSGNDVLTGSTGAVTVDNATGTKAAIAADGSGKSIKAAAAIAEVQTLTITADNFDNNNENLTITYGTNAAGGIGSYKYTTGFSIDVTKTAAVANDLILNP